jgi:hypothetical protein
VPGKGQFHKVEEYLYFHPTKTDRRGDGSAHGLEHGGYWARLSLSLLDSG